MIPFLVNKKFRRLYDTKIANSVLHTPLLISLLMHFQPGSRVSLTGLFLLFVPVTVVCNIGVLNWIKNYLSGLYFGFSGTFFSVAL